MKNLTEKTILIHSNSIIEIIYKEDYEECYVVDYLIECQRRGKNVLSCEFPNDKKQVFINGDEVFEFEVDIKKVIAISF